MIIQCVLLILGFALLIKGADVFVNASVGIAEKLKVPKVIIGLTIVAIGTSAPEAMISITASIRGANALAIGNVVGSNIFNLMCIIGICSMIKVMNVKVSDISKDFFISIFAAMLLLVLKILGGDFIPRIGSLLLLIVFACYMFFLIRKAMKAKDSESAEENESIKKIRPMPILAFFAVIGCVLIVAGGHFTVESATYIALNMGISKRVIGLTIVAIGTSLPELITSLVACKKGENEFALGNIIGSNIFNILFILGVAGIISPLEIESGLVFDTIFLVAGSTLVLIFVYTRKRIARQEGVIMALLYFSYMMFAIFSI